MGCRDVHINWTALYPRQLTTCCNAKVGRLGPGAELKEAVHSDFLVAATLHGQKMHDMKPHNIPPADRAELSRLGIHGVDRVGIRRTVAKLSMLSPQAIHEVEGLIEWVPPRQSWLWPNRAVEIDPIHAPVLMFSRNGYVREAALQAVNQLPDAPFFLAALVWRLNDWVEPVRRAAEGCARRELPRFSTCTVVGAAPFLLERMPHWDRWVSPPAIVLDTLARADCVQELLAQFGKTTDIPAGALRSAFRFGLLDHHLLSISLTAKRPEFRAVALKAMLAGEVTWVTHYERQWVDKRYGITRRVPILARRAVPRPAPVDILIRHGAADRNSLVRRAAAHGLVLHAASLTNIRSLMTLFDREKSPSVRWRIEYLARRH
jgi:hypothetical protein